MRSKLKFYNIFRNCLNHFYCTVEIALKKLSCRLAEESSSLSDDSLDCADDWSISLAELWLLWAISSTSGSESDPPTCSSSEDSANYCEFCCSLLSMTNLEKDITYNKTFFLYNFISPSCKKHIYKIDLYTEHITL